MPKKPREIEKILLQMDGYSNHKKVHIDITPIQQNPGKLQYHFIVRTYQRALKTQS